MHGLLLSPGHPGMVNSAVSAGACPMNQILGGVSGRQAVPDVTGTSLQLYRARMLELTLSLTSGNVMDEV